MSFAAKLAMAAAAGAGGGNLAGAFKPQQPQQQQAYGQQGPPGNTYGAHGQTQYGAPPGNNYNQPPQQGSYGQPQQQQGSYGQPPQQQHGGGSAASFYAGAGAGAAAGAMYGQHQQQGAYGQQPQYGAPPQQQQYGAPQQQQYGGGPPGGAPYGAPGGGAGQVDPSALTRVLEACIHDQRLAAFYPPGSAGQIAQRVVQTRAVETIMQEWRIPREIAYDLAKLALFDIIILVDDSGSMAFEESGARIVELRLILGKIARASALFDQDGLAVRFLNWQEQADRVVSERMVEELVGRCRFSGLTPLGTALDQKILQPAVLGPARQGTLRKPVLVVALTDGTPAGEPADALERAIRHCSDELARSRYGPDALSVMISQIGNDLKAREWLAKLDGNPAIGQLVDVTSNYEVESQELLQTTGIDLSPELWLAKLLLGSVDSSYDSKDERRR